MLIVHSPLSTLGNNVRRFRRKSGLSQESLASRCGLHRTYIGGIERGERNVSLLNLLRIAEALGVAAGSLLAGIQEKESR